MCSYSFDLSEIEANNSSEKCFHPIQLLDTQSESLLSKKRLLSCEEKEEYNFQGILDIFDKSEINPLKKVPIEEDPRYFRQKKSPLFKVVYPEKVLIFTEADIKLKDHFPKLHDFSKTNRSPEKLDKYLNPHYIRVVIKRRFFNTYLKNALNIMLREANYKTSFGFFEEKFVIDVSKPLINKIMNMNLHQFLISKEFYANKKGEINGNYENNLKIVEKIEKEGSFELNFILKRKIWDIYDEYINSQEFNEEIRRLQARPKRKTDKIKDDYYIEKYIFCAEHFIDFCTF